MGRVGYGTQARCGRKEASMRIIHVLRKPLSEGTVAANTLKHGAGGLNIDVSRIRDGSETNGPPPESVPNYKNVVYGRGFGGGAWANTTGRWPANVILQHLEGCRCEGTKKVKGTGPRAGGSGSRFNDPGNLLSRKGHEGVRTDHAGLADKDGKETVVNWTCEPGCVVAQMDEQSGVSKTPEKVTRGAGGQHGSFSPIGAQRDVPSYGDSGGASRFYKQVGGVK
jgi:hypothetical protein